MNEKLKTNNSDLGAVSVSLLNSLLQDLKGFQDMGFLPPDTKAGLGLLLMCCYTLPFSRI